MRLFKDPVWQFVGVLVAVAGIGVAVVLFSLSRPVKKLRVDILSNSPLVAVNTDIAKDMKILYKEKQVQTLSLILLRLANTGTEPITEGDYSEPIRISMTDSAGIGEVVVQETRPVGIRLAPIVSAKNQVELARVLLNPGDQAVLKILALNNDSTLRITARIAGVPNLEIQSVLERPDPKRAGDRAFFAVIGLAVFLIVSLLIWQSRRVMEWRRTQFGFDPAQHYYTLAQEMMLNGLSKDNTIRHVVGYLHRAFTWNASYLERIEKDPLFTPIQGYARYQALIEKFVGRRNTGK